MRRAIITLSSLACIAVSPMFAASSSDSSANDTLHTAYATEATLPHPNNVAFKHLDVALTLGTGGVGLEFATPITSFVKLRVGAEVMPQFSVPMYFNLSSYSTSGGLSTNFERMQELMYEFTGIETDETVKMKGRPDIIDLKCLFDFTPWSNKGWHFTIGFLYGSHRIAYAENYTSEATSLLGVKIFNNMHDYFTAEEYMEEPFPVLGYIDPDVGDTAKDKFAKYGRIGVHVGDYKDTGEPYLMEPGEDGMVKARAYVNRFKPYFGFGYGGAVTKDKRLTVALDAGVACWGTPKVITHEGVDLVRDVENIPGKVGTYVSILNAMKVYPEINLRIAFALF